MSTTSSAPANAATIGNYLVKLCREGRNGDAIARLYAPDIVSIESMGNEEMPAESRGIDAVRRKHDWWTANMEVHSADVRGPFVGDNDEFAVYFEYDTTFKPAGTRSSMREMALYAVQNGQIVREEFFYKTS
ncbi:MAG: SnoaL-like domain-containing protein [Gemmatimonadaceae bacterium]